MNQFEDAKKQLRPISVVEIKEILKREYPTEYSKMIIDDQAVIQRVDYFVSSIDYTKADRKLVQIKFPLFDRVKDNFKFFEGGEPKFGSISMIEHESNLYDFANQEGAEDNETHYEEDLNLEEVPLSISNDEIIQDQVKYFLPKETYKETCTKCSGQKFITCTNLECGGKHVWKCKKCIGHGEITCSNCKGNKYTRCHSCSGKGTKTRTEYRNSKPYQKTEKCSKCIGKGEIPCKRCGTTGKVRCNICNGDGEITCSYCYSDSAKWGMIDCSRCLTAGKLAQIVFLDTTIDYLKSSQIQISGDDLGIKEEILKNHVDIDRRSESVYKNMNGTITGRNEEYSNKVLVQYELDLHLSRNRYAAIVKADISYQVIPCVELKYKHLLTNKMYSITIVDIWQHPELFFETNAEKTKTSITSLGKSMVELFSKAFKTKGHKEKEDRKIEIKLMIYLAKADRKIEEEEKLFLSEEIASLKDFTNAEKKYFFELMNAEVLPELTAKDVSFNNSEKGKELVAKLEKMALADGEFEEAEMAVIQRLKKLL